MNNIADAVLRSLGCDANELTHRKVRHYIDPLASTGKSEEQLIFLGRAYLKEILNPDARYSGC
jgi:hypothetical protein